MTHVCHLFGASAGWEQRLGLAPLLNRPPGKDYNTTVAALSPIAADRLRLANHHVELVAGMAGYPEQTTSFFGSLLFDMLAARAMPRFLAARRIDLVHAWGVDAAWAARTAPATGTPLVLQLFDPVIAKKEIRRIRELARLGGSAVVCSCETVRRRLIEGGVPPEFCVVIRPAVDFSLISEWKQSPLRERLGLSKDEFVVIVPEPVSRAAGAADTFWAVTMISQTFGSIRLVLPGVSAEKRHILRQGGTLPRESPLVVPALEIPFEELLAVSDALVIAACRDISTTSIAWAFAAGTTVIGTAVHSVAEIVSNKLNGLLFRQVAGKSMVPPIIKALRDRDSHAHTRDIAHGQAYELFGTRRYLEQNHRLYENLLGSLSKK